MIGMITMMMTIVMMAGSLISLTCQAAPMAR